MYPAHKQIIESEQTPILEPVYNTAPIVVQSLKGIIQEALKLFIQQVWDQSPFPCVQHPIPSPELEQFYNAIVHPITEKTLI